VFGYKKYRSTKRKEKEKKKNSMKTIPCDDESVFLQMVKSVEGDEFE